MADTRVNALKIIELDEGWDAEKRLPLQLCSVCGVVKAILNPCAASYDAAKKASTNG